MTKKKRNGRLKRIHAPVLGSSHTEGAARVSSLYEVKELLSASYLPNETISQIQRQRFI